MDFVWVSYDDVGDRVVKVFVLVIQSGEFLEHEIGRRGPVKAFLGKFVLIGIDSSSCNEVILV